MLTVRRPSFATGCAVVVVATAGADAGTLQQTITLSEELRTAFYEHAPLRMAAGMESAVHSYCNANAKGPTAGVGSPAASQSGWLCAPSRHHYLRNVYLNGTKGTHGLVCESAGVLKLRYIGVDLAAEEVNAHTCVPVEFDGSTFHVISSSGTSRGDS